VVGRPIDRVEVAVGERVGVGALAIGPREVPASDHHVGRKRRARVVDPRRVVDPVGRVPDLTAERRVKIVHAAVDDGDVHTVARVAPRGDRVVDADERRVSDRLRRERRRPGDRHDPGERPERSDALRPVQRDGEAREHPMEAPGDRRSQLRRLALDGSDHLREPDPRGLRVDAARQRGQRRRVHPDEPA